MPLYVVVHTVSIPQSDVVNFHHCVIIPAIYIAICKYFIIDWLLRRKNTMRTVSQSTDELVRTHRMESQANTGKLN